MTQPPLTAYAMHHLLTYTHLCICVPLLLMHRLLTLASAAAWVTDSAQSPLRAWGQCSSCRLSWWVGSSATHSLCFSCRLGASRLHALSHAVTGSILPQHRRFGQDKHAAVWPGCIKHTRSLPNSSCHKRPLLPLRRFDRHCSGIQSGPMNMFLILSTHPGVSLQCLLFAPKRC